MTGKQIGKIRRTLEGKRAAGLCAWPRCRAERGPEGWCDTHSVTARAVADSYVL